MKLLYSFSFLRQNKSFCAAYLSQLHNLMYQNVLMLQEGGAADG